MGVKEADPEHCPLVAFMTERKDPEAELTGARGSFRRGGCVPAPTPPSARVAEGDVLG